MELGIIGLPKSGKTTVFNALTRGKAETAAYSAGTAVPNIGVVKVPDPRLRELERIFKPKRTVQAEVRYLDVAGAGKGLGKGEGIGFLAELSKADALIHVVRAFRDENVPHIEGSIDPERDIATLNLELAFSDMAIIEKRLQRLQDSMSKGARPSEREAALWEHALLVRIKKALEEDVPIRDQALEKDEARAIENYQFLTAKPLFLLINIGESELAEARALEERLRKRYERPLSRVGVLCGKLEMELAQLEEKEAEEFRSAMGITEAGLERMVRSSYGLLGLITFFTTVSEELKSWAIRRGTTAVKAAGKIHTDMERGFIRAEVIGYDDLIRCGSMAEARKRGLLRLEGKTYVVQDGDIMTILFNV